MNTIRKELITFCRELLQRQIGELQGALKDIREAANSAGKSSMGDKYETSREMMKQEEEKLAASMSHAQEQMATLSKIPLKGEGTTAAFGSVVVTPRGNYFISTSVGKIMHEGIPYFAVSASAPIGKILLGKQVGEPITFNGQTFAITALG